MWVTDSCYRNKRLIENHSGHDPVFLGPVIFHFTKDNQTFTQFALVLQASNSETRKLKKIGIDMEDAIFNGVQSFLLDVAKLYCVRHIKQQDEMKTGKLLAKFKCSEDEKVFEAKQYWREKS